MRGKHAPESSLSFYLSLTRVALSALAIAGVIAGVAIVALGERGPAPPVAAPTLTPSPSPSPADPAPTATPTTDPDPTLDPGPVPRDPEEVTVEVLNGTERPGLAGRTAERIEDLGYIVEGTGNTSATEVSVIVYEPGGEAEALSFQAAFPEFGELREGDRDLPVVLRLIIGADFP